MLTHFAFPFKCNVNVNANRKKGGNVYAKFVGGEAQRVGNLALHLKHLNCSNFHGNARLAKWN